MNPVSLDQPSDDGVEASADLYALLASERLDGDPEASAIHNDQAATVRIRVISRRTGAFQGGPHKHVLITWG